MEYQEILNQINHLNLEQEIGLKLMMNHKEHIQKITKLDLKLQC